MQKNSSWEESHIWYHGIVGERGHYFHQNVILPALKNIFKNFKTGSLLDLGCGQGVLSRTVPDSLEYHGVDLSFSLIQKAKELNKKKNAFFYVSDIPKKIEVPKMNFDLATFILSLQNMPDGKMAIQNTSSHLKKDGLLILVINHPCFRIPRQSAWQEDEKQHLIYRRINTYMSSLSIPLQTHPGKKDSAILYSYHFSLSTLSAWLFESGFAIQKLEELVSDKKSEGSKAKMEDRARKEFPLFLLITAIKTR